MAADALLHEFEDVFKQVFRKMKFELNKQLEQKISSSQAYILEILEAKGAQKISELADAMSITMSAVTGLSDKLIASGFAMRERMQEDRRIVMLSITPQGQEILHSVRQQRRQIVESFFQGLSEEDLQHLIRIYRRVLVNIGANEEE